MDLSNEYVCGKSHLTGTPKDEELAKKDSQQCEGPREARDMRGRLRRMELDSKVGTRGKRAGEKVADLQAFASQLSGVLCVII